MGVGGSLTLPLPLHFGVGVEEVEDSKYNLMIRYQFITKVYGDLVKQLCTDLARCCRFRICCRSADISPLPYLCHYTLVLEWRKWGRKVGRVDGKGVRSVVRFCGCWGKYMSQGSLVIHEIPDHITLAFLIFLIVF